MPRTSRRRRDHRKTPRAAEPSPSGARRPASRQGAPALATTRRGRGQPDLGEPRSPGVLRNNFASVICALIAQGAVSARGAFSPGRGPSRSRERRAGALSPPPTQRPRGAPAGRRPPSPRRPAPSAGGSPAPPPPPHPPPGGGVLPGGVRGGAGGGPRHARGPPARCWVGNRYPGRCVLGETKSAAVAPGTDRGAGETRLAPRTRRKPVDGSSAAAVRARVVSGGESLARASDAAEEDADREEGAGVPGRRERRGQDDGARPRPGRRVRGADGRRGAAAGRGQRGEEQVLGVPAEAGVHPRRQEGRHVLGKAAEKQRSGQALPGEAAAQRPGPGEQADRAGRGERHPEGRAALPQAEVWPDQLCGVCPGDPETQSFHGCVLSRLPGGQVQRGPLRGRARARDGDERLHLGHQALPAGLPVRRLRGVLAGTLAGRGRARWLREPRRQVPGHQARAGGAGELRQGAWRRAGRLPGLRVPEPHGDRLPRLLPLPASAAGRPVLQQLPQDVGDRGRRGGEVLGWRRRAAGPQGPHPLSRGASARARHRGESSGSELLGLAAQASHQSQSHADQSRSLRSRV
ncbi:nuclear factor interleukin-3-regulated protein isoform X1 [Panthera pardus]|uniref:Nuclear factor interleukin-3-regulated protein isoform X1 n=1 Tax=Panthera pardus TaxID=9691 RepID=A0A9W2VYK8_PANPR|nr:nuclear factor interleukin-3-regulated protein isoform X1 [Panthera pardus]